MDAGKFGALTLGETTCKWWRSQAYYDEGGWKGTQALDGGGAIDEPGDSQRRFAVVDDGRRHAT